MNDLQEQLSGSRVENEDGAVDWFGDQVALKGLADGYSVHVGVIYEPCDTETSYPPGRLDHQTHK